MSCSTDSTSTSQSPCQSASHPSPSEYSSSSLSWARKESREQRNHSRTGETRSIDSRSTSLSPPRAPGPFNMKQYDVIIIGTGSAMNIVDPMIQENPNIRIAVIDKDEPGGICLTRGCIPSKILLYPAELVRMIEEARDLGIDTNVRKVDFEKIMERMRSLIYKDIDDIREGLSSSKNIDYYHDTAEFISPYTMKVSGTTIASKMIFLCIGSKILIPPIKGLDKINYHTSDTVLKLKQLPESVAIVGGGYIAAEYGHFFSSMGSKVTIIGRNPQFLPDEEPEISK